jgi:hypothetical protein
MNSQNQVRKSLSLTASVDRKMLKALNGVPSLVLSALLRRADFAFAFQTTKPRVAKRIKKRDGKYRLSYHGFQLRDDWIRTTSEDPDTTS